MADDKKNPNASTKVVVRPLPKVVFFYMTWLGALACALLDGLFPAEVLGMTWMGIFLFNLATISFDFTLDRLFMILMVFGLIGGAIYQYGIPEQVSTLLFSLNPVMNQGFYWLIFGIFSLLYAAVFIHTRVNYWEFRPGEIVHREGLFMRTKRYPASQAHWDRVVPDILERLLLGTGTMILTTSKEEPPVILEHVLGIGSIDDRIADVLRIQVTTAQPAGPSAG